MSEAIQRYSLINCHNRYREWMDLEASDKGEFVKFSDHEKAIKELEKSNAEMLEKLKQIYKAQFDKRGLI